MNRFALALLVLLAPALAAAPDDDLVAAAKKAKQKRDKSTTKVITNADVKKSKGSVVENTAAGAAPADAPADKSLVDRYENEYRDRLVANEKRAAAKARVAALEKQLLAVEQSYFEENDLDKRDREIVARFAVVNNELRAAREQLDALTESPPPIHEP